MQISRFFSRSNPTPTTEKTTWRGLVALLQHTHDHTDKNAVPLWSPATFGGSRANRNVEQITCLVLDLDVITHDELAEVVERLEPYQALIHSTWSHEHKYKCPHCNEGHPLDWSTCKKTSQDVPPPMRIPRACARLIVALSRPLNPHEWADFWRAGVAHLQAPADHHCSDPARAYYIAAVPDDPDVEHFNVEFEGQPLDVDALLKQAPELPPPPPTLPLAFDEFERYAKTLCRKRDEYQQELGERLMRVCRGESWADVGERDTVLYRMAGLLAARFHDRDPVAIAHHFIPSISRMASTPGAPTREDVEDKISRQQRDVAVEIHRTQIESSQREQRLIQYAFRSLRCEPYRKDELPPEREWILVHQGFYFFFVDGAYRGPFSKGDEKIAARECLSPAAPHINLYATLKNGAVRLRPLGDLVEDYGQVLDGVLADYRAQQVYFDREERYIVEAPTPLRDIKPTFHPQIAKWLELLGGQYLEHLHTWIAALTDLDRVCAALVLIGPKSAGKSMLAHGLARLWSTRGPTPMSEAFNHFNGELMHNPLVLADEALPTDYKGRTLTTELREHIQARRRVINAKYQLQRTLLGATRNIIASNNDHILATNEDLSPYDLAAVAARYFTLRLDDTPGAYLETQDTWGEGWVDNDMIAEHALWLRDNHKWESQERFIIPPLDTFAHRAMTVQGGTRGEVCKWLVKYILTPAPAQNAVGVAEFIRVEDGPTMLVNIRALEAGWSLYLDEHKPTAGRLARALASLCTTERICRRTDNGNVIYKTIVPENLYAWAEYHGYVADWAELKDRLSKLFR